MTVTTIKTEVPPHPAKFSAPILKELSGALSVLPPARRKPWVVWDPFGGVGGVHSLATDLVTTWATEIEPEWAAAHPRTVVADALRAPFRPGTFDAVVTSPCYGNRMADHHEAKDPCSACLGVGGTGGKYLSDWRECPKCKGTGLSLRNTYRHKLGRPLSPGSAAGLQWGDDYRTFHEEVWGEVWIMLRRGGKFFLNVSDHIRKGQVMPVVRWHQDTILDMPFEMLGKIKIPTQRNRQGSNGNLRVDAEYLLIFEKR